MQKNFDDKFICNDIQKILIKMAKKDVITDFEKEDMYLMCRKTLSKKYTPRDEWVIEEFKNETEDFAPDFTISRRSPSPLYWKITEKIWVAIFLEDINQKHVDLFNTYIQQNEQENVDIKGKIIITPAGIDTSFVKDSDFELIRLNIFRIEKQRSAKKNNVFIP